VVTHPANSLAQDRESSPAETSVLPTMLLQIFNILGKYIEKVTEAVGIVSSFVHAVKLT